MMIGMQNPAPMAVAESGTVPEFGLPDRMRKALQAAGIDIQEMTDYLGVSRSTVTRWLSDSCPPSVQTLRLWAIRCGVSYEWLADGEAAGQ